MATVLSPSKRKFVDHLRELRTSKGFTQAALAARLKKPQSYVAKIESGERRVDVTEYIAICRVLGVDEKRAFANLLAAV